MGSLSQWIVHGEAIGLAFLVVCLAACVALAFWLGPALARRRARRARARLGVPSLLDSGGERRGKTVRGELEAQAFVSGLGDGGSPIAIAAIRGAPPEAGARPIHSTFCSDELVVTVDGKSVELREGVDLLCGTAETTCLVGDLPELLRGRLEEEHGELPKGHKITLWTVAPGDGVLVRGALRPAPGGDSNWEMLADEIPEGGLHALLAAAVTAPVVERRLALTVTAGVVSGLLVYLAVSWGIAVWAVENISSRELDEGALALGLSSPFSRRAALRRAVDVLADAGKLELAEQAARASGQRDALRSAGRGWARRGHYDKATALLAEFWRENDRTAPGGSAFYREGSFGAFLLANDLDAAAGVAGRTIEDLPLSVECVLDSVAAKNGDERAVARLKRAVQEGEHPGCSILGALLSEGRAQTDALWQCHECAASFELDILYTIHLHLSLREARCSGTLGAESCSRTALDAARHVAFHTWQTKVHNWLGDAKLVRSAPAEERALLGLLGKSGEISPDDRALRVRVAESAAIFDLTTGMEDEARGWASLAVSDWEAFVRAGKAPVVAPFDARGEDSPLAKRFDPARELARAAALAASIELRAGNPERVEPLLPKMSAEPELQRELEAWSRLLGSDEPLGRDEAQELLLASRLDFSIGLNRGEEYLEDVYSAFGGDSAGLADRAGSHGVEPHLLLALSPRVGAARRSQIADAVTGRQARLGTSVDPFLSISRLYRSLVTLEALGDEEEARDVRETLGRIRAALLREETSPLWQVYFFGEGRDSRQRGGR